MIYCVWYPSGGFGHFISAILSLHGKNFSRPGIETVNFSATGDSHALPLVAPKYFKDPKNYSVEFDNNLNYSVLIDNGIRNEGKKFTNFFPDATVIKLCYDDLSWPVVSRTMIDKAMKSSIEDELPLSEWGHKDQWAVREKYFLFFRDHTLRHSWKPDSNTKNLFVNDILDYNVLVDQLTKFGIICNNFKPLWDQWHASNYKYFAPMTTCQEIIKNIRNRVQQNLTDITDIWTQSILYFYIWTEFEFEVPHNDYSNCFTNTDEIVTMLDKHGVIIDPH